MPTHQKDAMVSSMSLLSTGDETKDSNSSTAKTSWTDKSNYSGRSGWQPTWLQPRPLVGIFSLIVTIACVFFSLAILVASDNQPIESWRIQPTVYLAIASAVANSALRVAHTQAIPIAWWYAASKGSTVRGLERQWESSTSLAMALRHVWHMDFVIGASLCTALMMIDGPLLQRASSVTLATQTKVVALNLTISPEVPRGFSGEYVAFSNDYITLEPTDVTADVVDAWANNMTISLPVEGCGEDVTCRVAARGPGLQSTNCTNTTWPISTAMYNSANASWGPWGSYYLPPPFNVSVNPAFYITVGAGAQGNKSTAASENVVLTVGLISVFNSQGQFVETTCTLVPATLEYDLQITKGNEVAILPTSNPIGRFIELANNTKSSNIKANMTAPSSIGQFVDTIDAFVNANASMGPPEFGSTWEPIAWTYNGEVSKYINYSNGVFDQNYYSPMPDIISAFNELCFRAGATSGTWSNISSLIDVGLSPNQTLTGTQTVTQNVFVSDLRWYAGATILEILTVLVVLPLFLGWWKLDSRLRLSPFGLALAFDAPLVRNVESTKGAEGVVAGLGDLPIRFGFVQSSDGASAAGLDGRHPSTARLGIGETRQVSGVRRRAHSVA